VSGVEGVEVHFLDSELLDKVDDGVELEEENRLIERLNVETLENCYDDFNVRLFHDEGVTEFDDLRFGKTSFDHFFDTELRECSLIEECLRDLEHKGEL